MSGLTSFFANTHAEREATGDPRLPLEERYDGRNDYEGRVRTAAEQLVVARYLLPEDADVVVTLALERYDYAIATGTQAGLAVPT